MGPVKVTEGTRDIDRAVGDQRTQFDSAHEGSPELAGGLGCRPGRVEHFVGMRPERLARGGEADPLPRSVEQFHPELTFQFRDRRRQRRLDDMRPLCRPRETHLAGHRDEVFDLA